MRPINIKTPETCKAAGSDPVFKVFTNAKKDGPAELLIMEEIGQNFFGEGIAAKDVAGFLKDNATREITVRINSPGGLVYDGLQIYNGLLSHEPHVNVIVEGLAFSAASFIAMAGDTIKMHKASDLGIHRAGGVAMGNSKVMRDVASWLDTIDEHLVDIYADRTGQPATQIEKWLDGDVDGTLFSAAEAVEHGFADEIIDPKAGKEKAAARKRIAASHAATLMAVRKR